MNEDRLSDLLWGATVPNAERAQQRTLDACQARVAGRAVAPAQREPSRWWGRRRARMVALAGAGALVILIAVPLLRDAGTDTEGTSFDSFAAIASAQPEAPYQHFEWEAVERYSWPPHYDEDVDHPEVLGREQRVSVWVGDDLRYERGTYEGNPGKPIPVEYLFDRTRGACFPDSMAVEASTSERSATIRESESDDEEGVSCIDYCPPLDRMWADPGLPTDPSELRNALKADLRAPLELSPAEQRRLEGGMCPGDHEIEHEADPTMVLPVAVSEGIDGDRLEIVSELGLGPYSPDQMPLTQQLFSRALTYLINPSSSPELRAALFQFLADLDGVVLTTGQTDSLGREAAVVTFEPPRTEDNQGATIRESLYLDPETSEVLETAVRVESEEGVPADQRVWGTYVETFTEREPADSLPPEAQPLLDELNRARGEG
jgi:hypothetical protein